jgi:predicted protein tyrosine phosphatase
VKRCVEFHVLSHEAVEQYEPHGVEVCISIGDPRGTPATLSPAFAAVLRLTFNDIVESPAKEDILFAGEHAADILGFVRQWPAAHGIVVHCEFGASRSPGVALGICDAFGWPVEELERGFPSWNRLVRRLIGQAARESAQTPVRRQ